MTSWPRAANIFRDAGILVDVKPGLSPEELGEIIGDYDGLAIRSTTKVTLELLDKAPAESGWPCRDWC